MKEVDIDLVVQRALEKHPGVKCIRPSSPETMDQAMRNVQRFVVHYNHFRLHSAIGYVTPAGKLARLEPEIDRERDRKLEEARQRRQQIRQQQVA
jgi:transposase InsO family protein